MSRNRPQPAQQRCSCVGRDGGDVDDVRPAAGCCDNVRRGRRYRCVPARLRPVGDPLADITRLRDVAVVIKDWLAFKLLPP
jgi:hypothetical protein